MSNENSTHVDQVELHLTRYESGTLALEDLQANLEGELGAMEGPNLLELRKALGNFVNLLEQYLYALPERKRTASVAEAIASLRSVIAAYRG